MMVRMRCYNELSISLICTTGALRDRISQNLNRCMKQRVTKGTRYTHGWEQSGRERNLLHSQNSHTCLSRNLPRIRSCNLITFQVKTVFLKTDSFRLAL